MMKRADWLAMVVVMLGLMFPVMAQAHCDTLNGPVVNAARVALERGEVTPVLMWIQAADVAEVRAAFRQALAVRKLGPEAQEMADNYFFETLVRVHRAGEGAPYNGLQATPADPIIALADGALDSGSVDELVGKITAHISHGIRERFANALRKKRYANASVVTGRAYVEAYVEYIHYIEGIHGAVMVNGTPGEAAANEQPSTGRNHHQR